MDCSFASLSKFCQTSVPMRPQYYNPMAKDTIHQSTSGSHCQDTKATRDSGRKVYLFLSPNNF